MYKKIVLLLVAGVTFDFYAAENRTISFHEAVTKGDMQEIARLAENTKQHDINGRDQYGNTPLHIALQMKNPHTAIIGQLIRLGADVNAENNLGETCVWVAWNNSNVRTNQELFALISQHAE